MKTMQTTGQIDEIRTCLIALMQQRNVNLAMMAACADVVAADARFNLRVCTVEKGNASHERFVDLLDAYDRLTEQCLRSVATFHAQADHVALIRSLESVTSELQACIVVPLA